MCRKDSPNECPRYNTKQSDGEAPVILELWGRRNTSLLPSLPGPLWLEAVAPDRVLSMGQIEVNCTYAKLNCLELFICINMDLALDNLLELICHKTQLTNQTFMSTGID